MRCAPLLTLVTACALAFGAQAQTAQRNLAAKVRAKAPPPPVTAQVEFVRGATALPKAVVLPRKTAAQRRRAAAAPPPPAPTPLTAGSELTEGMRVEVPEDGYLRLRLADGSVVRVLAESDVELRRLRRKGSRGAYESVIDVKRGKVESEVPPKQPGRVFEIHAPGAVASVRGTRFDVSVDAEGRVGTAVTDGKVAVSPRAKSNRLMRGTTLMAGEGVVLGTDGKLGAQRSLPPTPDLSSLPAESQDANLLAFNLAPLPGAEGGYEVRIAPDDELRDVVRNGVFRGGRAEFVALADGSYTVGVRARDREGLAGGEARRQIVINAHPVPPLYQSPMPGERVASEAGQLICSQTTGAEWVHVQVARDGDFSRPVIDESRLALCRLGLAALPVGDYAWRVSSVQALPGGGFEQGPFAAPQRFSVVPLPTVEAVDVADGNESPTLSWQALPGQTFLAQLSRDAAFGTLVREVELTKPSWTLGDLPRGNYFVRLQARDAGGLVGPFSPPRRVRIGGVVQTSTGSGLTSSDGEPVHRP